MATYRTAAQASTLAGDALRAGASWWVRRHTTRGPQRAHAVVARTLAAYGSSWFTAGRLRLTAQCALKLRTPDCDTFEIAPAPDTLPTDWPACPACLDALGETRP